MEKNQQLPFAFGIGLGSGMVLGGLALHFFKQRKTLDADSVLENVRASFKAEGPIEGAWIQFQKKPLQKFAIKTKTYTGGITRIEDGRLAQYEFLADAYTGTIIDIQRKPL